MRHLYYDECVCIRFFFCILFILHTVRLNVYFNTYTSSVIICNDLVHTRSCRVIVNRMQRELGNA